MAFESGQMDNSIEIMSKYEVQALFDELKEAAIEHAKFVIGMFPTKRAFFDPYGQIVYLNVDESEHKLEDTAIFFKQKHAPTELDNALFKSREWRLCFHEWRNHLAERSEDLPDDVAVCPQ